MMGRKQKVTQSEYDVLYETRVYNPSARVRKVYKQQMNRRERRDGKMLLAVRRHQELIA